MKKTLEKKLRQTTHRLESRYRKLKDSEGAKKASHKRFFDLADEVLASDTLAQKVVIVPSVYAKEPVWYTERFHPEWRLLSVADEDEEDGGVKILLEEKPEFKPFTFVNPDLGLVFQRTIAKGQVQVDDEALKEYEPELYEELVEMVPQLKPLDEMTDEQRAKLQKYLYREPSKRRLEPPRKATGD